jgi:FAD/FMN-containing dehydrogenase
MITTATPTALAEVMTGTVVVEGDPGWDAARTGFNLAIDQSPAAVAFPANEQDVVAVVRYANEQGLRVAPQATGHNPGPLGDLSDAILLSVSQMIDVSIDAAARRVRVGAGAKWEIVAPQLSELGLAGLHGSSPDVGIAGYSLGGGMGWLARKYGLQTNSVTAIELVTADGRLLRADASNEPDLFWALRGGGGNFGVVTAIEFSVYPLTELYAGVMFFPFERAGEVLHAWTEMLPSLPDELMTWASLLHFPDTPDVPEPVRGGSFTVVYAAFLGDEAAGRELLRPVADLGPVMDTRDMVPPIVLGDMAMDPPDPLPYALGHDLLDDLPADALDDLLAVAGPGSDAPLALVQLRHMGGALARKEPHAGARATLPGNISMLALGVVEGDESAAAVDAAIQSVKRALEQHRAGDYPNFVEEPTDASSFFDEETWARLREVKALYDPTDVFKGNHHVPPADSGR